MRAYDEVIGVHRRHVAAQQLRQLCAFGRVGVELVERFDQLGPSGE